MNLHNIIEASNKEFKQNLVNFCKSQDFRKFSPDLAEAFSKGLQSALSEAGKLAYKMFIESFEEPKDFICIGNKRLKFKQVSKKKFLTPFGEIPFNRRLYQHDRGGKSYFPLDAKWGVEGEYTTPEVRDAICFAAGLITPDESAKLFQKSSLFHPSSTAIKHVISKTGEFVEENRKEINTSIRKEEQIPSGSKAVVFSLDGANVLLNEPGPKKGRKVQRPKLGYQNNEKTSFKNAMVGSISFYDREKGKPKRISSRYTSQMPEENFLTFRGHFEDEVKHVKDQIASSVKKIIIVDGHPSLKGYIRDNPLFEDCHVTIDFYHAMDHLSLCSEILHGKSSPKFFDLVSFGF
jgi:hypothetical protein